MRHRTATPLLATVLLAAGVSAAPGWAQKRVPRIGLLDPANVGARPGLVEVLRAMGYVEGQTIAFESGVAGDHPERFPELAADQARVVVNLEAAVSIGLTLAQSILLRADEVIRLRE